MSTHHTPVAQQKLVRFRIGSKDLIRRIDIETNTDTGTPISIYHIYPSLAEWAGKDVPDDVNPRSHDDNALKGTVPKAIAATLEEHPEDFYLANRGATILAEAVRFDPDKGIVEIVMSDTEGGEPQHGMADGATTDRVVAQKQAESAGRLHFKDMPREKVPLFLQRARMHLEVLVGLEDRERIARLVQGRNTSRQVRSWTLADFKGEFDWIRDVIERQGGEFAGKIGYEENAPQEVNILEVLSILTLFHSQFNQQGKAPTVAYSSKGRLDKRLADPDHAPGYKALAPLLEDLLRLHDHLYTHFHRAYKAARPGGRPGRRGKGDNRILPRNPHDCRLTGKRAEYVIPAGVLYPLLQSLRALIKYDEDTGKAQWRTDPFKFFDKNQAALMDNLLEQLAVLGGNPQTVGKTKTVYTALYNQARLVYADQCEE